MESLTLSKQAIDNNRRFTNLFGCSCSRDKCDRFIAHKNKIEAIKLFRNSDWQMLKVRSIPNWSGYSYGSEDNMHPFCPICILEYGLEWVYTKESTIEPYRPDKLYRGHFTIGFDIDAKATNPWAAQESMEKILSNLMTYLVAEHTPADLGLGWYDIECRYVNETAK